MNFYQKIEILDNLLESALYSETESSTFMRILSDNKTAIYFWQEKRSPHYFEYFTKLKYYENVLNGSSKGENYINQAYVSDYLLRVASEHQDEVCKILKRIRTSNNRVLWNFACTGLQLAPQLCATLVPNVKKWVTNKHLASTNFAPEIIKWYDHLLKGKEYDAALDLLSILTEPRTKKKKTPKSLGGSPRSLSINVNAPIDFYWFEKMLELKVPALLKMRPLESVMILDESLEKALQSEYGGTPDYSYIWRPAIENHDQNHRGFDFKQSIMEALVLALEELCSSNHTSKALLILSDYLKKKYSIFQRIAIHILRKNYSRYPELCKEILSNKAYPHSYELYHEYYLFLSDNFDNIHEEAFAGILDNIIENAWHNPEESADLQEKQKKYYIFERFKRLEGKLRPHYAEMLAEYEKEFTKKKVHDTVSYSVMSYDYESPLTVQELRNMSVEKMKESFQKYKTENAGFNSPSVEGLSRVFLELLKSETDWVQQNDAFFLLDLKPNYAYRYLQHVEELLQNAPNSINKQKRIEILTLCMRLARLEELPDWYYGPDRFISFDGVRSRILEIVRIMIRKKDIELTPIEIKQVWNIIEYLCFCKSSPGPNEEVGKQVDSFTTAINSVRGKAMERLIDYGLWYAAKNKDKNADVPEPDRFDSEIKYKELLEHKLDKRNEKSPAVHSIFGIYLPNLMYLNKRWVIENISKIFPDNQPMYWEAAWASYITGSKFYTDVFKLLHPQYELAVKRLENGTLIKERGISRRTEEALAEHLVIACINGLENINEDTCLLRKFALVKKNNAAYHAVQYIWHLLLDSTIFADNPEGRPSFWPQAKIYWDLRIQTAKSYITDSDKNNVPEATSEFSLFLTWLKYIPSEVTLDELANLLTETLILNKEGYHLPELIDYLQQKSGEEPELAVRILKQAVETEAQIYFYQGKERIMEEILRKGLSTGNKTVLAEADIVMNTLGEKGNYYFKDLWLEYFINAN